MQLAGLHKLCPIINTISEDKPVNEPLSEETGDTEPTAKDTTKISEGQNA